MICHRGRQSVCRSQPICGRVCVGVQQVSACFVWTSSDSASAFLFESPSS